MALDKVTTAVIANDAITSDQLGVGAIAGSDIAADVMEIKPHIKPGTLYPAVAGKLLDGTTTHGSNGSTAYGTAQSDGRKYYYTDIKGSKPIKDPRIGAHFGCQRYKLKSLQLLEQETASHGQNVYSVDGREWLKGVGSWWVWNDANTSRGIISATQNDFFEITGYFSSANFIAYADTNDRSVRATIDGGSEISTAIGGSAGATTPLGNRYVDAGSMSQLVSTTLGIHTLKIRKQGTGSTTAVNGIELVLHDTGSTARKSQINIPAQNVVSYGKKFSVGSDTLTNAVHKHYNPFAFKTDGSTAWASGAHNGTSLPVGTGSSHNIDTATSLGLEKWKHTNYYKPYNGGRVVIWVASDGTIKTSVNMMPPNAQNTSGTAVSEKGDDSAGTSSAAVANNTHLPTFSDQAIDHSQTELAKTFHYGEFGNGAANGGTGGTYADASMIRDSVGDIVSYCMDDGLTSISSDGAERTTYSGACNAAFRPANGDRYVHITFIGTGVSFPETYGWLHSESANENVKTFKELAQNLPYGTHIIRMNRESSANDGWIQVDGQSVMTSIQNPIFTEVSFHQPKRPPIPEDACILADYMLMADYVQNTNNGNHLISKGVRICSQTRDVHYKEQAAFVASFYDAGAQPGMGYICSSSHTSNTDQNEYTLPAFGTTFQINGHTSQSANDLHIDDTDVAQSGTTGGNHGDISYPDASVELGMHKFGVHGLASNDYSPYISGLGFKIASPIHTSSHYQTFETPDYKELVGGDRNMEQNNLVVTADGKSWDEVTRDTSYIGIRSGLTCGDTIALGANEWVFAEIDKWRGQFGTNQNNCMQKDFAIAYDRIVCLEVGWYLISYHARATSGLEFQNYLYKNGEIASVALEANSHNGDRGGCGKTITMHLNRGDYLQWKNGSALKDDSGQYNSFHVTKIE